MAARKHQNGEITLDKASSDQLLAFITQFGLVLNITDVSQPTPQGCQPHHNGCTSRQNSPEENDERQKQDRSETLTRVMSGYSTPPPSPSNSTTHWTQTTSTGVQVNLSTHSTPRNSACVINSGLFTLGRTDSQRSFDSDQSSTHPGVQPSSARESWDSGILDESTRRRTETIIRQSTPHLHADERRPGSASTRQVSVTNCIVRSASPTTCESFLEVVPATTHSNDLPLVPVEAVAPNPPAEVVPVQRRGDTRTIVRGNRLPLVQPKDSNQQDNARDIPEIQDPETKARQALMVISDRITTNMCGLKKKQTYTVEEVRRILEDIMDEIAILRNPNQKGSGRQRRARCREAMYHEDDRSDLRADENAMKQTTKRRSGEASAACGEEGKEGKETVRNKRQRARKPDDDKSFV